MKTLFYSSILCIISFFSAISLSNCKKCPSKNADETFEYPNGKDGAALGFIGNETLLYLKNNQDTIRFVGSGIQNYYTYATIPAGECEKDYKYGNRKVVFTNANEGNIIFHLYATGAFEYSYEVIFKRTLIGPINTIDISFMTPITLITKNRAFNNVKVFTDKNDSAYLYSTSSDLPVYRLPRIKLDTNIYEVIP